MNEKRQHWEKVFVTKTPAEVSWTEKYPKTSMDCIQTLTLDKALPVIDIGGGDSRLVDALLEDGFTDVSVLDISEKALQRAQERLGTRSKEVSWIVSDVLDFKPEKKYALWHDRASFHFLTQQQDILRYTQLVNQVVSNTLIVGTFSTSGPLKCSGLPITQYSCASHSNNFEGGFETLDCIEVTHRTPFDTEQNFVFGSFQKKN